MGIITSIVKAAFKTEATIMYIDNKIAAAVVKPLNIKWLNKRLEKTTNDIKKWSYLKEK